MIYAYNAELERVHVSEPGNAPYFCPACLEELTIHDTIYKGSEMKYKKKNNKEIIQKFGTNSLQFPYFNHPYNWCLFEPESAPHIICKNAVSSFLSHAGINNHIDYCYHDMILDIYVPEHKIAIDLQYITSTRMSMETRIKYINQRDLASMWIWIRGETFGKMDTKNNYANLKAKVMEKRYLETIPLVESGENRREYAYVFMDGRELVGLRPQRQKGKVFFGPTTVITEPKFDIYSTSQGYMAFFK